LAIELENNRGDSLTKHILLPCSKSKSVTHIEQLAWTSKCSIASWKKTWLRQKVRTPALELYTGRILQDQIKICEQFDDVKIYIISAGAGLVCPISKKIPSYEATFQDPNRAKIGHWHELPEGGLEQISLKPEDSVVCFAPPSYQRALKTDPVFGKICEQLIVFSTSPLVDLAKESIRIHPRSKEVLRVSSRDLNTELLRLYLSQGKKRMDSLYRDCLVLPVTKKRRSVNDDELRELISEAPPSIQSSITKTVQYIRHECNVSSIDTRVRRILLKIRNDEL